jgi:hypothetical protein
MEAPISRYGAVAALAALLTTGASAYLAMGGHRCPLPLLIAFYAAGAAEIIVLCRVAVPAWLQGGLILFVIASLTTLTARTDVFGVPGTEVAAADEAVARPAAGGADVVASKTGMRGDPTSGGGTRSEGGAKVIFASAASGDDGWATMLNAAYDRRLGGPQASALLISGNVGAKRIGKATSVQVVWGVSADGVSVRCGSTSAFGSDYPVLSDQIQRGFGEALSRSVELRRASCP